MRDVVLGGLLLLVCLYILSKMEVFIRYLDFIVDNLEKCLYHKQPGAFKYLLRTLVFIVSQGLGGLCMVPACDNSIDFWWQLTSLAIGFGIFKMSADYFEKSYSESIADVKIKI